MRKETSVKVSKEFKKYLSDVKKRGENFEDTLKRLMQSTPSSTPTDEGIPNSVPRFPIDKEKLILVDDKQAEEIIKEGKPVIIIDDKCYQKI